MCESSDARIICFVNKLQNKFKTVVFALESTSFYGVHIVNFLSSDQQLLAFNPHVYCLNPKMIANYRKSFIGIDKTNLSMLLSLLILLE